MAAKHEQIPVTLGSAVGLGGTFNVPYPSGRGARDYLGGTDHILVSNGGQTLSAASSDFSIDFQAAQMVVTLKNGRGSLPAGSKVHVNVERAALLDGAEQAADIDPSILLMKAVVVRLGKPVASAAAGIVASQAATLASGLATGINGSLAASGKAVLDVARNVVAAWTGTAVLTVTGKDQFGNVVRESSASGTSFTGKKAFKEVTSITVSADVTALTVGTGKVLGLPCYLDRAADVVKELENGAAPTAGAIVAGDLATATATTGDVRGTYAPNSNPDGTRAFELMAWVGRPDGRGKAQY